MINKLLSLGVLLLGITSVQVQAESVEVGRATIDLAETKWLPLTTAEGKTLLDSGAAGVLSTDDRAFVLLSGDKITAILYVSSSKGGSSIRTNWSNTCNGTDNTYAVSLTGNPNGLECGRATGTLKSDVYLSRAIPVVMKAVETNRFVLPLLLQSSSATVGNSNGSMLHVNLLSTPSFVGLPGIDISNVPTRVKQAHAAWANQLVVSVKESVYSISGKMTLPPVAYVLAAGTVSTSK